MTGVQALGRPLGAHHRLGSRARAAVPFLRRHRGLVALLVAAAALRALAVVAIYPGIWFSDTNNYVRVAATGTLSPARVSGYALVVAPFWHLGSAGALIVLQHVAGVALAVLIYALLLRRGVSRPVALLAAVPAGLDLYLVDIEHMIMSETAFHAALLAALAVLLWNERIGLVAAAVAGLLLGYAGVVRSVGVPLIAVFVLYLIVRRVGWRPLGAFCVGWLLVVGGYAALFDAEHGRFALTESDGRFLYARVAPFADCARLGRLPAGERSLCPDPRHRLTTNAYRWSPQSPIRGLGARGDPRARDFALRVIRDRPLAYARVVGADFLHYFEPGRRVGHNDYPVAAWQFPADPHRWRYPSYRGPIRPGHAVRRHGIDPSQYITRMAGRPRTDAAASRVLHVLQRYAYTSGQVLAACVLLVLAALLRRHGAERLRLDATLLVAVALVALAVASALSLFDYRYGLAAVLLLPGAAALAGTALVRGER